MVQQDQQPGCYVLPIAFLLLDPPSHCLVKAVSNVTVIVPISYFVKVQRRGAVRWQICGTSFVFMWSYYYDKHPGSSVGIATELRAARSGIESRWGRDFSPVQTGSGAHPASCTVGTGYFLGLRWPGRGAVPPRPSSAEVLERVELYLYPP